MSYHNTPSNPMKSKTNAQGQAAPAGFHYMPDGTLMSDAEHASLYGSGSGNGKGEGEDKHIGSGPPKPPSPTGTCTHAYWLALADEIVWPVHSSHSLTTLPAGQARWYYEWLIEQKWNRFILGPDGVYAPDPSQSTGCKVLRDSINSITNTLNLSQGALPGDPHYLQQDSIIFREAQIVWASTLLEVCDCNDVPAENIQAKLLSGGSKSVSFDTPKTNYDSIIIKGKENTENKYIGSGPPKPPSLAGTCNHQYFLDLADEMLWPLVDLTNYPDPDHARWWFEWQIQYVWDKFVLGPDGVYTPDPSQSTGCQVLRDIIISHQDYIAQYLTLPPIDSDSLLWYQTRISWASILLETCDCNEIPPEDTQAKLAGNGSKAQHDGRWVRAQVCLLQPHNNLGCPGLPANAIMTGLSNPTGYENFGCANSITYGLDPFSGQLGWMVTCNCESCQGDFRNMTIGGQTPEIGDGFYVTQNARGIGSYDPNWGVNSLTTPGIITTDVGPFPNSACPGVTPTGIISPGDPNYPEWMTRLRFRVVGRGPIQTWDDDTPFIPELDFEKDWFPCNATYPHPNGFPTGEDNVLGDLDDLDNLDKWPTGIPNASTLGKLTPRGNTNIKGYVLNPDGAYIPEEKFQQRYGDGSSKVITELKLNFTDISSTTETRPLEIIGDDGAEFILEIKNAAGSYYNFISQTFQAASSSLEGKIHNKVYRDEVVFPTVESDDQYDIYLYTKPGTIHTSYIETLFGDGSIDLNRSIGSNSVLMRKVAYQYTTLTLTLSGYSPNGTVSGTTGTDTLTVFRGKNKTKTAFSFTYTAAGTAAYRIIKQPVSDDIISFVQPVVGSDPIDLAGENIYPDARAAFTGDDINGAVTSGSVVRMDNTDLSAVIAVGDKITTAVTTDTVDGAVSSSNRIVMDNNVATKMAVGDQVTGTGIPVGSVVTVTHLDPDTDNAKELQVSEAVSISDGVTLTFSSKINRDLTTVTVVETSGTATDFTMSQAIQFRDNAPLTFWPRMNYSWPINNFANLIKEGMIVVPGTNVTTNTKVGRYQNKTTILSGTSRESTQVNKVVPAIDTLRKKPTVVKGLVTVQEGNIVFDKQQVLALAGDTLKIGGYGETEALRLYDWEVKFSDLVVTLTAPTTTTTSAVVGSATIPVADTEGVINNVSRVGGIGINSTLQNPLITSGGGADGSGNWTVDAVQDLESGITLTVENTSRVATISGNIQIVKAGTADQTIRFDVEKLLSTSA